MVWRGQFDKVFVGGEWVEPSSPNTLAVVSPVTEEVVAQVPNAGAGDVDRAVVAARRAFDQGPWPRMALAERVTVMSRFHDLYRARLDDIAQLVTEEMGCPITISKVVQGETPRLILQSYLELVETYPFSSIRRSPTGSAFVSREPVGVVAAVVPWNVPQSVSMQKVAPALLSGCTMILKPAPETPLDAYLMAELLEEAGIPEGVFNVLPADREGSEALVSHWGVDKVAFTGSTGAGRRIAAICGEGLRRVTLELGGKSAAVFLDDADLDAAVESLRFGSFRNSGQVCSLKTRILVSRRREKELLERLVALIGTMPVGDPMDPHTQIGPMVSQRHQGVVNRYLDIGLAEGAEAVVGGGHDVAFDHGWYVQPTVFAGVQPDDRIAQEEIFGPVLAVLTYSNEDEAVAIANNSTYGLNGAVFTSDLDHGMDVASRIRTGTVELNGSPAGLYSPMGGFKASGLGREQGHEGLDSYTESRAIGVPREVADTLAAI